MAGSPKQIYVWALNGERLHHFDTTTEAAAFFGVTVAHLSKVCADGRQFRDFHLTNTPQRSAPIKKAP